MTLLEAREHGSQVAGEQTGGLWTFDRVYLREGEWIAVLRRDPQIGDLAAAWLGGKPDLASRMASSGCTYIGHTQPEPVVYVTRHVPVGRR